MDLETFLTAVFCITDDFVQAFGRAHKLRQRGPMPKLADSEVLTIELVGEFLGLDTDQNFHAYFRRYFAHLFPDAVCTARPWPARRRTCGPSNRRSGNISRPRWPAIPRWS